MRRSIVLSVAGLLAAVSTAVAQPGSSITLTPADNIQAAINSGQYIEIVLAPGTYNQVIDFDGAALTLRSTDPDDPAVVAGTILDGSNLGTTVVVFDDGEGPDSVLRGLTITGGDASSAAPNDRGGGIRCFPGSPTIDRCVIVDNIAGAAGGGLYLSSSTPTIIDTAFIGNTSSQGGGLYANSPGAGFTLDRCIFEDNHAPVAGAGVRSNGTTMLVRDSTFIDNLCNANGGGIYANDTQVFVERTLFSGNLAERGGGIYTLSENAQGVISDSVFENNLASATGGGAYLRTPFLIRNATFVGNGGSSAAIDVAAGTTTVISSILWNNDGAFELGGNGVEIARHSLIQGGFPGDGNIEADPMFTAAADGDYRLSADSPAIDAGDTSALSDEYPVDFLGLPRALDRPETPDTGIARLGINVDMGAFEFQPEGGGGGDPTCPQDIDGSGAVDFADLLAVLSSFGACP